ncbi:MAG: hypothetical protein FJZ87_08990 [Chloroflexi bacterium]|nr:hypothetical protein [Chloroflexota bacterium]
MNAQTSMQKPGLYTAIAVMTLTSGIINLFWGFIASVTALSTIVGVICLPLTILPTVLGIFEIIYAAKLFSDQLQPVQPSPSMAVFQILAFVYGNIFSMVVGILNLIFFNDQAVKEYFTFRNSGGPLSMVSASAAGTPLAQIRTPPKETDPNPTP